MRILVLTVFVFGLLTMSLSATSLAADAASKALYRKALYDAAARQKLMAAGVLDEKSDAVSNDKLREAVHAFLEVYFDGDRSDSTAALTRLDDIAAAFTKFVGLKDSNYSNDINIKVPSNLLTELKLLSSGKETLHISPDAAEALKYGSYRYPLRAQTPQSLLREIFYKNSNLDIETMQSDETQFLVSGTVRDRDGRIDHHFLRKAFQFGPATTALYMKYDHAAPEQFAVPQFLEPLLRTRVPPRTLMTLENPDERHEALVKWADETFAKALKRRQPPESITSIRRFSERQSEQAQAWRDKRLDELKREIFEVAVLPEVDARLEGWADWRKDVAWQIVVRSATNISSTLFDSSNGWKTIEIDDCYVSKRKNRENSDYQEVRIVFATNRAKGEEFAVKKNGKTHYDVRKFFKNEVDTNNKLHYGCVMMTVPKDGVAERRRESHVYQDWAWRTKVRKVTAESVKRYYSSRKYVYLGDSGENARGERVRLSDTERWFFPREDKALLYVHGYNTAFHESLLRIAQIAASSGYPGRIYLFSWPSARELTSYVADMDASEKSDPYLAAFVRSILLDTKIKQLDVIAHSMGGQVFLRAFSRFRSSFDQVKKVRFGKVIFAAPDVSQSVFKEKINDIVPYANKSLGVSVYASSLDRVLLVSSFLRGGRPRAGDLSRDTKFESEVVKVIDATRPAWWCAPSQYSFLGHSYFSNREPVLRDIIAQLMPRWKRRETGVTPFSRDQKCWYQEKDEKTAAKASN